MSIDERESDDVKAIIEEMPLVINEDLLNQYGTTFSVALDEYGMFDVKAG